MKTILIALTILMTMQAFADKERIERNVKLPLYTPQNVQNIYVINDKKDVYAYAQPYTLSSQIHAKRKILYVAVMQSKGENLYTTLDTGFITTAHGEDKNHCLYFIGHTKEQSSEDLESFMYLFFEFNRDQQKINFHKFVLRQDDQKIQDKFDALDTLCNFHEFTLNTKVKLRSSKQEVRLQDVLPELKQPLLQLDAVSLEMDAKK